MLTEYLGAVLLILFAEMGDKTQFLAIAFAMKYPVRKILLGVALGSFLNHGLAVILGRILLEFIKPEIVGFAAGAMFIFFAFNSLKLEDEEVEESKSKFGPVLTVALAFFLGELGDKTQLAALGLAVDSTYMLPIVLGTVTGMLLTSALGIVIGLRLGKNVPEDKLKVAAFSIFMFFGLQKLYSAYFYQINIAYFIGLTLILLAISLFAIRKFLSKYKSIEETSFARQAEALKQLKSKVEFKVENMCRGTEYCGNCDGKECLVGYMKYLLTHSDGIITEAASEKIASLKNKIVDKAEARMIIQFLIEYYEQYPVEFTQNEQLNQLRKTAEFIVYGRILDINDFEKYKEELR